MGYMSPCQWAGRAGQRASPLCRLDTVARLLHCGEDALAVGDSGGRSGGRGDGRDGSRDGDCDNGREVAMAMAVLAPNQAEYPVEQTLWHISSTVGRTTHRRW